VALYGWLWGATGKPDAQPELQKGRALGNEFNPFTGYPADKLM
jgi:hypothetical protein